MTIHSQLDYDCNNCNEKYIPFKIDTECPRCGDISDIVLPIINETKEALRFNEFKMPKAYGVFSLGDHYILLATKAVAEIDKSKSPIDNAKIFVEQFPKEDHYFKNHCTEFLKVIITWAEKYIGVEPDSDNSTPQDFFGWPEGAFVKPYPSSDLEKEPGILIDYAPNCGPNDTRKHIPSRHIEKKKDYDDEIELRNLIKEASKWRNIKEKPGAFVSYAPNMGPYAPNMCTLSPELRKEIERRMRGSVWK